jgi:hypothetical protein
MDLTNAALVCPSRPLIRPILKINVIKLESGFVDGNNERVRVLCISMFNDDGEMEMLLRRCQMNEMINE